MAGLYWHVNQQDKISTFTKQAHQVNKLLIQYDQAVPQLLE